MSKPQDNKTKEPQNKLKIVSLIIWIFFVMFVLLAGFVLYSRIKDFDIQTQQIQSSISQVLDVDVTNTIQSVFGVSDESEEDDTINEVEVEENLTDEIETERQLQLRESLLLQLPDESDNPNYPVTFTEPTEDGVEIKIDDGEYEFQESPYLLPSLDLGSHTISFRFNDESGVSRILEDEIIIIPRSPVVSSTQKSDFNENEGIVIEGSALPNSKLLFVVSSSVVTDFVDVDNSGNWNVDLSDTVSSGDHNVVFMVRKNGFSSDFSEPFEFSIGQVVGVETNSGIISDESLTQTLSINSVWEANNYLYVYTVLGGFFFLILLSLYFSASRGSRNLQILSRIKDRKSCDLDEKEELNSDELKEDNSNNSSIRDKLEAIRAGNVDGMDESKDSDISDNATVKETKEKSKKNVKKSKSKLKKKKNNRKKLDKKTQDPEKSDAEIINDESQSKEKEVKKEKNKKGASKKKVKIYSKKEFLEEYEDEFEEDDENNKDDKESNSSKRVESGKDKSKKESKSKRIEITLTSN